MYRFEKPSLCYINLYNISVSIGYHVKRSAYKQRAPCASFKLTDKSRFLPSINESL